MIDPDLLDKFDSIEDLPVSEETLAAYLEGNLTNDENIAINNQIATSNMQWFIDEITTSNTITAENDINGLNMTDDYMKVESPHINTDDNLGASVLSEANKQFGIEAQNIEFDPDTYQWESDTCAIRSQEIVLRSFGIYVPQDELVSQAESYGWYSKGDGTPMNDVGNLLDLYGISNHRVANANVFNLVDELGQGHKVIVGVDLDELYGNSFWQSIKEFLVGKTPNHAMIVSGIDTSDPEHLKVILTDPGTGKTLFECPYEKFLTAWNDSECFMVATDAPAPLEYNVEEMINFDYQQGHVSFLGSIPFEKYHDEIAQKATDYIDSLDAYIESVERLIGDDFSSQDLFDDMTNKHEMAHNSAVELLRDNHIGNTSETPVTSDTSTHDDGFFTDEGLDDMDEDFNEIITQL